MSYIKILMAMLLSIALISGCAEVTEKSTVEIISEESVYIGQLNLDKVNEEDNPQYYYITVNESIETVYVRDTKEDSFEHSTDLLNFERTKRGFEFSYMNYKDEEIKKTFEIKSSSIIEDENGIWYEWDGPENWIISE